MMKIFDAFLDFLFPQTCVVCGQRLGADEKHLCVDCLLNLPRTNYHLQEENRLEEYLGGKFVFHRASAFCYFYKQGSLQKIVHEFKYKNNPSLARYIGRLYGESLLGSDFIAGVDYLIPVPLHLKRRKERGYNQAEEICIGFSEATNIPISTDAILRVVNNSSQTKHSKAERWKNVEGIFQYTGVVPMEGKKILLVDDIITTGSTLEAIVKSFPEDQTPTINIMALGIAM